MRVSLVYLKVVGQSDPNAPEPSYYAGFEKRFCATYQQFKPQIPHELRVVYCGNGETHNGSTISLLSHFSHFYNGGGWDIGAHQKAAQEFDADLAVFMATPCYFWANGWLERLVAAREQYGDGLYGPMASYENSPHIRTGCFACSPQLFRRYQTPIDTRDKCRKFESAEWCFTRWAQHQGVPVKMVTWHECLDEPDWRNGPNLFRKGDQSQCIVWDRHVDIWRDASIEEKIRLTNRADGR